MPTPQSDQPIEKIAIVPLSAERMAIKEKKCTQFDDKIAALLDSKDRLIAAQAADLQKLQDEIDETCLMRDALDALQ